MAYTIKTTKPNLKDIKLPPMMGNKTSTPMTMPKKTTPSMNTNGYNKKYMKVKNVLKTAPMPSYMNNKTSTPRLPKK